MPFNPKNKINGYSMDYIIYDSVDYMSESKPTNPEHEEPHDKWPDAYDNSRKEAD